MVDYGKIAGMQVPALWSYVGPTDCGASCLPKMPLSILESKKEGQKMNRDTKIGITLIIASLASLTTFAMIGCNITAIAAHETLKTFGIESEIAGADVFEKGYGHAYIIVDGRPYEPRFLGLWLSSNVDYNDPIFRYKSTNKFLTAGYTVFPTISTLTSALGEAY